MEIGSQNLIDSKYPLKPSFIWRVLHCSLYLNGGLTFFIGSFFYFPSSENLTAGAWLFIIGSVCFFVADMSWLNNRVGCFYFEQYRNDFESTYCKDNHLPPITTPMGQLLRMETGVNFLLSAFGSGMYIVGSVLFLPYISLLDGNAVYIFASAVIFTAQFWKLYRQGTRVHQDCFSLEPLQSDVSGACVDLCAALGALGYLVGGIVFLPWLDITYEDTVQGSVFFLLGGAFFGLSGLFMMYRYFFSGRFQ